MGHWAPVPSVVAGLDIYAPDGLDPPAHYEDATPGLTAGVSYIGCRENSFPDPYDHLTRYRFLITPGFTGTIDLTATIAIITNLIAAQGRPPADYFTALLGVGAYVWSGTDTCPTYTPPSGGGFRPLDPSDPDEPPLKDDNEFSQLILNSMDVASDTLGALNFVSQDDTAYVPNAPPLPYPIGNEVGWGGFLARPTALTWAGQDVGDPTFYNARMFTQAELEGLSWEISGNVLGEAQERVPLTVDITAFRRTPVVAAASAGLMCVL